MSPPQAQAGGRGARSGGASAHSGGEGAGEGGRPRPILRRIARHAAEMRRRMPPLMPRRGRPLHILSISDLVVFSTLIPRRTMYAVMSPLVLNSDLAIFTSLSLGGIRPGGGSHPYKMCPGWAGAIRHSRRGPGPWGGCTLRGWQSQGRTWRAPATARAGRAFGCGRSAGRFEPRKIRACGGRMPARRAASSKGETCPPTSAGAGKVDAGTRITLRTPGQSAHLSTPYKRRCAEKRCAMPSGASSASLRRRRARRPAPAACSSAALTRREAGTAADKHAKTASAGIGRADPDG